MSTGTDVGVGDSELAYLDVAPADGTTTATLLARKPDGTSTTVAVTGAVLVPIPGSSPTQYSQRWTSAQVVVYDQPGHWILHWAVTGTGVGVEDLDVWVTASPVAGGPTWTPGRSRVATYLPRRTLVRSASSTISSQDTYAFTFDSTTVPTGLVVSRLIADGVAWVQSRVYPMAAGSTDAAAVCVALYAAAMIERTWPDDDQSLQRALDLERRLDQMLGDLVRANAAANTGTITGQPPAPQYQFPFPDDNYLDYPSYV